MQENRVTPEFDIVVTGIGGSGKTALINRITGSASEVDHDVGHVGGLISTKSTLGNYDVVFWETECIRKEASATDLLKCPKPSVLILCVNITAPRFKESHVEALANVSRYFNKRIWNHCIIALTFVDLLWKKPSLDGFSTMKMKEALKDIAVDWKSCISKTLASNVPQKVLRKIEFVPIACKKENSTDPELIDEQKALGALKSACIKVFESNARKSLPDKGFYKFAGGLVGCMGLVFPPLLIVTVPCGVYIGGKVYSHISG